VRVDRIEQPSIAQAQLLDAVHAPYRGAVEIVPGLIGGQVQFAFPIAGTALVGTAQGRACMLAVTAPERMPQLPDIPSLKEVYRSDLRVQESWSCLWVPAGTPKPVITKLFDATHVAHARPEVGLTMKPMQGIRVVDISPVIDAAAGMVATQSVPAARLRCARSGEGAYLDVSMAQAAVHRMLTPAVAAAAEGRDRPRVGNRGFSGSPGGAI